MDAKATLKEGNVSLAPVGLAVKADLGTLAPKVVTKDSELYLRSRYKLGSESASLQARGVVSPKKMPQVRPCSLGDVEG